MTAACRVCGRPLRTAASRTRGVGPVCARATTAPSPTHAAGDRPEPGPGQTALPLRPYQPTLNSL